ncbi:uncharacterized protein BX663DRAFT_542043 [Cokeromyces recurvatus]|uniref:uncharacterized protein n=1 Tax=Cokeromyces recurvatus TaxID=90255 RepID=UPI00221EBA8D|nr:uncharacterized protein BX663DRAFT_542043 [Cokeromyces recurvatus]KAI7904377.1 hypothetical protein BX663DRAFT_542043 [Cokeromyces recurvatus]
MPKAANKCMILRNSGKQMEKVGVDFQKNCIFIDAAGFYTQMLRSRIWSKKGDPANVEVHSRRGANVTIVGCISPFGIIKFSKVEPLKQPVASLYNKKGYCFQKQPIVEVDHYVLPFTVLFNERRENYK